MTKHFGRYAFVLLAGAAAFGCSSDGDGGTDPGSISITVAPSSGTVQQGGSTTATATLTRADGFTGQVNLTVTGQPTGVTAGISNVQTAGAVTTGTVTINVAAATAVGVYPLVVHGTGTGVDEATFTYTLTVTAAPAPSFVLSLTQPALTIVQGASTPTTTVNIARTNFPGDVALSVLNLPTGVTAAFAPANPQTGNSSVLTLTVPLATPVGVYNTLSVQGVGTAGTVSTPLTLTVTAPAASFTLGLTNANLSIAQGASTPTTTVNINRTNFTGDVALSVLNLPAGVTAAFAPANPQTGNSSVLTLTVPLATPVGVYNTLQVQGVGTAGTVTTPLTLTVTAAPVVGNYTLSTVQPSPVGVTQGNSANVTVNINRTGGNTSNIALTFTGTLPTGMTLAFVPSSTTANSSVLTVTTTAATPVGATPIVIRGNTAGLTEQTVNLTINVNAPGGSGNVTVTFATCPAASKAVWLAFMDGTAGTWTAVTGVSDVYQFNITQGKGSFAYVTLGTGTSTIIVQHFTQAELTAGTFNFCGTVTTPNTRTANGTYSNLPTGFIAQISFGGGSAIAAGLAAGPFQITNAMNTGAFDLVAYAKLAASPGGGDRVFISRGENPANGGNFAQDVNFTGPLSAAAVAATATLSGLTGSETQGFASVNFYTGGSACVLSNLYTLLTAPPTSTLYGVPASLRNAATDMHNINVTVFNGTTSFRSLSENFLDPVARAANPFVLPTQLPVPVATDAGGPYKRPSITVTGVPAELNLSHVMTYQDQTATGKTGVVSATQGWVGGANLTLVLPNFAGVGSFNNAWAPATSDVLNWSITSSGGTFTGLCTAGQRFVSASRTGTL